MLSKCDFPLKLFGPRQANLLLIAYASSEGSGEPAHPRSLARTFAARSYKQWIKKNLQTESQIRGPSEWLGMRGWNLSWRNARRHKFAWRGSFDKIHGSNLYNLIFCDNLIFLYKSDMLILVTGLEFYTVPWLPSCEQQISQLMRKRYVSHRQTAKAPASLRSLARASHQCPLRDSIAEISRHVMRKPVLAICEQQRCRSACAVLSAPLWFATEIV